MSEDYIDHAEEERMGVFAKYDKGREEGAKIDDWEDPALELYHVMDRYGFIHLGNKENKDNGDNAGPSSAVRDSVVPKVKAEELKRINLEAERVEKWLKMTSASRWPKFRHSEKLKRRTYKGIPNKLRSLVWGRLLDLDTIKEQQKGKYQEMYELARKYSPDVRQIDLDVNRTYRDTIMFRQRYGKEQKSLFNILCAYSVYNSEVGYCQGMSQVAALLLMYLAEEDAFWGLAQLMTHIRYGMHGFFIAGFPKLARFQAHHDKVLQVMLPKLKKHFEKHGVETGLYTLKWFFQCFLDRVPFELSLRLWDIFLLEGDRVLVCGAYSILKIHQKQLLARKNMDEILNYLQVSIPIKFGVDNDKAIENYKEHSEELQRRKLDTAGEAGDDELPKKPFGVIEHIPQPAPRENPTDRVSKEIAAKKELRATLAAEEVIDEDLEPEDVSVTEKTATPVNMSPVGTSIETSFDDSPRNFATRPLSSVSNISNTSTKADTISNGPSGKSTPIKMNGLHHKSPHSPSIQSSHLGNSQNQYDFSEDVEYQSNASGVVRTETQTRTMEISAEEKLDFEKLIEECEEFVSMEHSNAVINHSSTSSSNHRSHTSSGKTYNRSQLPVFKQKSPSPPPPPPRSPSNIHDGRLSSSSNYTPKGRSDLSSTRVPPPVNPRRLLMTNSGAVDNSNIPGVSSSSSTAVRIHVPYRDDSSTETSANASQISPRNGYDINKSDPNRIKIDVSSHSR